MYERLSLLGVALMGPAIVLAHTGDVNDMDGGHMGGYGHMMDFSGGGLLMWILFLVVVGVLIYFMLKAGQARGPGMQSHQTPLDILKKRYAQGEISKQQFDEMKRDL